MNTNIDPNDIGTLEDNWPGIRKVALKILKKRLKSDIELSTCLPMRFDRDLILGNGKWGVVIGSPTIEEIVIKITTDPFEWFLIEMLLNDPDLCDHPALPITIGTSVLDMKHKELPLYMIVRENLQIGIPLAHSNPLVRMKELLLYDFVQPMEQFEIKIAEYLNRNQNTNLLEVSLIHSYMNGEVKRQITKIKSKLPKVNKDSKFLQLIDFQKKLLDKGIAIVDIHVNNIGFRKYNNLHKLFEDVPRTDMNCVVVSDLGMAYGTPIFLQSGMVYKTFDEMISHLSTILMDYTEFKRTRKSRYNPANISASLFIDELRSCCEDANMRGTNVLTDPLCMRNIDQLTNATLELMPKIDMPVSVVKLNIRNEFVNIIKEWIDIERIIGHNGDKLLFKCYITKIEKGICHCIFSKELSHEKDQPIGLFCTEASSSTTTKILMLAENMQKQVSTRTVKIQVQTEFLLKLNGVLYDKIHSN
jgi:hypothetical protein